eukprot:529018-Prymnesium_polylepis.1
MVDFGFLASAQDTQPAPVLGRLWVSAPGTVSPLHFDMQARHRVCRRERQARRGCFRRSSPCVAALLPPQDSYLCQVRGVKRMLLWPDDLLPAFE